MFKTYYVTFGQKDIEKRDGWYEVIAVNWLHAKWIVQKKFGREWSNLYNESNFQTKFYPKGKLGILT